MDKKEIGLYVHIPFCKQKCFYCDFPSYGGIDDLMDEYVEALVKEIESKASNYKIGTIFIGGGTPSYLTLKNIEILLDSINKLDLKENLEFTMECNPGVLEVEKLKAMKKKGVNRISMGLQSADNNLLKALGRIHTYEEFLNNYNEAKKVGFENINIDLMFGLPGQSVKVYIDTLEKIAKLNPKHISAYSLIVEEGTKFYSLYQKDKLILPTEEEEREMYIKTKEILNRYGYKQYEISNYSKDNFECEHNKVYWRLKDYLGLGSSSSSYLNGKRFKNINSVKEYIHRINMNENVQEEVHQNSIEDNMEEFMFMGLRLIEGININTFEEKFSRTIDSIYKEVIDKNITKGLLEREGAYLKLTEKGIELSNIVMSDFILEK